MKQVQRVSANYSADLFGICSALYELGGLIIMHDASGCNSTYATHDEPRWFHMDSMVYISALEEYDAVLGNEEKLISDILECALEKKPKFIALCGSPIAFIMGTDFKGLARVIEKRTKIPTFGFKTSGMYTYQQGARQAFKKLIERFCPDDFIKEERKIGDPLRVNLLGVTPLDFSIGKNIDNLHLFLTNCGFNENMCLAMGDSLENISKAGNGDVNLVLSSTGILSAEVLKEKYGTPYVIGIPMGESGCKALREAIILTAKDKETRVISGRQVLINPDALYIRRKTGTLQGKTFSPEKTIPKTSFYKNKEILIIGEPVFTESFRQCLENEFGAEKVKVICPLEDSLGFLREEDKRTDEEDIIKEYLLKADIIFADPLYKRLLNETESHPEKIFISFPEENYSGRDRKSVV